MLLDSYLPLSLGIELAFDSIDYLYFYTPPYIILVWLLKLMGVGVYRQWLYALGSSDGLCLRGQPVQQMTCEFLGALAIVLLFIKVS